jgi:hypothetical protein
MVNAAVVEPAWASAMSSPALLAPLLVAPPLSAICCRA